MDVVARHLAGSLNSVTGTNILELYPYRGANRDFIYYIEAIDIGEDASGTLGVEYRLSTAGPWCDPAEESSIDLTDIQQMEMRAPIQALRFTSSNGSDVYSINVYQA